MTTYRLDPQYREEYEGALSVIISRGDLLALRDRTSRDGATTHLSVIGTGAMGPMNVTIHVAHALGVNVSKAGAGSWTIAASSGGTNPVTDLQERLRRAGFESLVIREG